MPAQDQLEIIDPAGRIRFYPLDLAKGITNIGRHIDNDIVINRPGVAPFHAMLDHRSKPYTLVVLAQREKTSLDNEPAPINIPTPLNNWASLEIGGHQIIFLSGDSPQPPEALAAPVAVAAAPAQTATTEPPQVLPLVPPLTPANLTPVAQPIPVDPTAALSVEYSTRALSLDAGQSATLDLTIINGGYKTLLFQIAVESLDPAWVNINPAQLELNSRQRATVSLTFAVPPNTTANAGTQTALVSVITPAYPDWKNQSRISLTINPVSDFAVSALSPRVQSLYSNQPYVQTTFEVTNRGNNDNAFRLTGEDERFNCRCEFKLPGETLYQPRQAELRLHPGETGKVTTRISPITRRNIGLGARHHFFTITVAPQSGGHLPRSLLGEVREQPLIGTPLLILAAVILLALFALALRPSISTFSASPVEVAAGQSVTLTWSASPLSSLRISPDVGNVIGPDGRMSITPTHDTVYTLIAENFLSWISPSLFRATREVKVLVDPVLPSILFTTDRESVAAGDSVTLSWQVSNADELVLINNGLPEAIPQGQYNSSKSVKVDQDTVFVLTARNKFTTVDGVSATINVRVNGSLPVTVPPNQPTQSQSSSQQPVVDRFEVSPASITAGQQVTIYWSVSGVDKVQIDPLPGEFPASGNLVVSPDQTTAYTLTATNGTTPVRLVKQVIVNPAPGAPTIVSLTANPSTVAPGSPESHAVKIAWQVTGESTDIQLAGPGLAPSTHLPATGDLTVSVDNTATFTLSALNGSLTTIQSVQVNVTAPSPILTGVSPNTATAGTTTQTITVTGSNFVTGSAVQWNGSARATTYISANQLSASLTAADLANAGTFNITVFNPAPGGGVSAPQAFTVNNPAPIISSLSPNSAPAGTSSLTLVINGSGFSSQTQVRWNGSQRAVSSFSTTQLSVNISSSDLATAGTVTVSVVNPVPGGGSDAAIFTIVAATDTPTPTVTPVPTATTIPASPAPPPGP